MLLDHVLIAVSDLAEAAQVLGDEHGLASVEGGRHPGWGTANRIVPLGGTYLELVAVVDDGEAQRSDFGRWVSDAAGEAPTLFGWAVRTRVLDTVSRRLGLVPTAGSRTGSDGTTLRWRTAGVDEAARDPALPFFIEWEPGAPLPGDARPAQGSVLQLQLQGDRERLAAWLGAHSMPITVAPGPPALLGLVLDGPRGRTVIGGQRPDRPPTGSG